MKTTTPIFGGGSLFSFRVLLTVLCHLNLMKHYTLPVLLKGDQLIHIKLYPLGSTEVSKPLDTTLIVQGAHSDKLLSFLPARLMGYSERDDKEFAIQSVSKTGGELQIKLATGLQIHLPPVCSCEVKIVDGREDGITDLLYEDNKDDLTGIRFIAKTEQGEFSGFHRVKYVSPARLFDVAIDFGSESSQMTICSHDSEYLVRTPMVDCLKNHFYHAATEEVHQEETSELYKTLFFLKKEDASFDPMAAPGADPSELLPLITRVSETDRLQDSSRLISNLKLAHLGAYSFEIAFRSHYQGVPAKNINDMMEEVHQKIINSFLHVALKEIEKQLPPDTVFYIRLKLLVPNVISQKSVSRLIRGTNTFLDTLRGNAGLRAFQTLTVSESDASFLGYWSENKPDGASNNRSESTRFIIIDMGKGTTDFSVISSDEDFQVTSEYRSGFVGAGNVITYAFIETLITLIFGKNENKKRKAIKKLLMNDAAVARLELLGLVERLKANYGKDGCRRIEELTFSNEIQGILRSGDIETIDDRQLRKFVTEILDKQPSIQDEFGYIEEAVVELCNRIVESLTLFVSGGYSIERKQKVKLILTGRSFLFQPLYHRIKSVFHKLFGTAIEIIPLDDPNDKTRLKKICLQGTFSNTVLNYSSGLIGIPLAANRSYITPPALMSDTGAGSRRGLINGWLFDWMGLTPPSEWAESPIPGDEGTQTEKKENLAGSNLRKMALGSYSMTQEFKPERDTIFISGVHYEFDTGIGNEFRLYFDGEQIYARTRNQRVELRVSPSFSRNQRFVFETLFPYNTHSKEEDIVVQTDTDTLPEL